MYGKILVVFKAFQCFSFLFADYHRLSSIGGEQALAKIVATLFEAAENHFGALPVRLFCALRVSFGKLLSFIVVLPLRLLLLSFNVCILHDFHMFTLMSTFVC